MLDFGTGADGEFHPLSNTSISGTKNYTSVNIPAGVTVTFDNVTIKSQGLVTIEGILNGDGGGLAGGAGATAYQGSGYDAVGNGHGHGGYGCRVDWWTAGGGGGGGYGTAGGTGGSPSPYPAYGGDAFGDTIITTLLGGGGGGGGGQQANPNRSGGNGGAGGGAIKIIAPSMVISGSILARGIAGGAGAWAGGGGGAGGSIFLQAYIITATGGSILATGGAGGSNSVSGGAGGEGRIRLDYGTLIDGTISPTAGYHEEVHPVRPQAIFL